MLGVPLVLDAGGIAVFLRAEEVIGVDDDLVEAVIPAEIGQVQQRQLRLQCQAQAVLGLQFDAGQGGEALVVQEQHGALAQPVEFPVAQAVENRQAVEHPLPQVGIDRVAGEDAFALPGAKGPHAEASSGAGRSP